MLEYDLLVRAIVAWEASQIFIFYVGLAPLLHEKRASTTQGVQHSANDIIMDVDIVEEECSTMMMHGK